MYVRTEVAQYSSCICAFSGTWFQVVHLVQAIHRVQTAHLVQAFHLVQAGGPGFRVDNCSPFFRVQDGGLQTRCV